MVLPVAVTPAGLPIGVHVIGRRWADDALLDVAEALETAVLRFSAPPGY